MAVTNELLQSENFGMETDNSIRYIHVRNVQNVVCALRATVMATLPKVEIVSTRLEIQRMCN
jgi:hypothetical protein